MGRSWVNMHCITYPSIYLQRRNLSTQIDTRPMIFPGLALETFPALFLCSSQYFFVGAKATECMLCAQTLNTTSTFDERLGFNLSSRHLYSIIRNWKVSQKTMNVVRAYVPRKARIRWKACRSAANYAPAFSPAPHSLIFVLSKWLVAHHPVATHLSRGEEWCQESSQYAFRPHRQGRRDAVSGRS